MNRPRYTGKPDNKNPADWPGARPAQQQEAAGYLAPPGLAAAVTVALDLGMPLLLTGEPGCGKSRLADSLAYELGFPPDYLLRFLVKSDSEGRDLFYRFDTLGRFHAAHIQDANTDPLRFLTYQALGQAILLAKGRAAVPKSLLTPWALEKLPEPGRRCIVLIDEIDKAPREVPNDILDEIENLRFSVPELDHDAPIELSDAEQQNRPIVIFTSNEERDLPAAFLRRCIYYHLELPPFRRPDHEGVSIEDIVARRVGERFARHDGLLAEALLLFRFLRLQAERQRLEKAPSLAELLDWLRFLSLRLPASDTLRQHPDFEASLAALLKHRGDRENWDSRLRAEFADYRPDAA